MNKESNGSYSTSQKVATIALVLIAGGWLLIPAVTFWREGRWWASLAWPALWVIGYQLAKYKQRKYDEWIERSWEGFARCPTCGGKGFIPSKSS